MKRLTVAMWAFSAGVAYRVILDVLDRAAHRARPRTTPGRKRP